MRLGIDGTNLRSGGGITHLKEILCEAAPQRCGFERVVLWSSRRTLDALPDRPWLEKSHRPELDRSLPHRLLWQSTALTRLARRDCDVLFSPGGLYLGGFRPVVTMSRTALPFEPEERGRYPLSLARLRLALLKYGQTATFRRGTATIFLTAYGERLIRAQAGPLGSLTAVIPHGVAAEFRSPPRPARPIEAFDDAHPFGWLYVSDVYLYKHQWQVIEAARRLRQEGLPIRLELVGRIFDRGAERRMREALRQTDPDGAFVTYVGPVPHRELPERYRAADGFVFASSCENLPNILLEAMAAGLPIATSDRGPMPEVLDGAGAYFDPEAPASIADAMRRLMLDPALRDRSARAAYERALQFDWSRTADATFRLLQRVAEDFGANPSAAGAYA
jgi:glycosyltransferase involved in cell wall biosynthesis